MKYAAKRYKNGGILKRVLNYCGKYDTFCPTALIPTQEKEK
jgi:hypothetical protein